MEEQRRKSLRDTSIYFIGIFVGFLVGITSRSPEEMLMGLLAIVVTLGIIIVFDFNRKPGRVVNDGQR